MKHEPIRDDHGVPTYPYLVYLPDGKVGITRSATAHHAWAVAKVSHHKGGWRIDGIFNTACDRGPDDIVATAERISDDEAYRFCVRREIEVKN